MPRSWDTCVVFLTDRQCWWWNAWREFTATELHGLADSEEEARQAMTRAIEQADQSPPTGVPRVDRSGGGRA